MSNPFLNLNGMGPEEMQMLQPHIDQLKSNDDKLKQFYLQYSNRRREPSVILICALIGFAGFSGIQRFITGQIGMGLLYFFTGGLCLIGTILDIVNHKKLALEYNTQMADEAMMLMRY